MKQIIALLLLVLVAFPTALAQNLEETFIDNQETTVVYPCGPNDIECPIPYPTPGIDVVFVIDSTGSMHDEIREVKIQLSNIVRTVESGYPKPDLRIGLVTYRDHKKEEHEYLFKQFDLTRDTDSILKELKRLEARGGGDYPEAVEDGLNVAIHKMNWRYEYGSLPVEPRYAPLDQQDTYTYPNTKKIVILVGDAAPHGYGSQDSSYDQGCPDGHYYKNLVTDANNKGITIYTVSGSGMDSIGISIWKEIARKTGGSYHRLSYVRRDLHQYYAENEVADEFVSEAMADSDYEESSNTILTNSMADFARKAIVGEAKSMGVSYSGEEPIEPVVYGEEEPIESKSFGGFLREIFNTLIFWD